MHRTLHPQGPSLGRPAVALVSVLALLAFACFPVLAQAETVYENESTTLPGGGAGKTPTQHKNPDSPESSPRAHDSTPDNGGTEQPNESSGQGPSTGNPSTPNGGGVAQGKDGEGANVANNQPGGTVQDAKPLATTTTSADDDSSSPLVPILIAVAVLAAISIGAVLYRQRRGNDSGRFSPNAS